MLASVFEHHPHRARASGAYFGDPCFVMLTPSSQETGPPANPARSLSKAKGSTGRHVKNALRAIEFRMA
ncbi:protein of unknown function [Azospirillum lipoferum 4B]|uniref:Uncharacterized protein n=1 Tax=Azospirillum lipoferum (strain 4B) TaxID=862719 RepID=G7Z5L6_AZOL4|nr:protein of unknown function [Azospirillum lipoferum 4B]